MIYLPSSFSLHESIKAFKIGDTKNNIKYDSGNHPYTIVLKKVFTDGSGDKSPAMITAIAIQAIHQNSI